MSQAIFSHFFCYTVGDGKNLYMGTLQRMACVGMKKKKPNGKKKTNQISEKKTKSNGGKKKPNHFFS